ncbi:MAG: cytidylate kinase-like family protein [Candidatus Kapabacteria bacterium]|nr:cytidylate kinase-like family protein [Candidatus Kapabacteria bacterium]
MEKENKFVKYLSKVLKQEEGIKKGGGPVITISRDHGCSAGFIAEKLVERINEYMSLNKKHKKWIWISKEILEKSAEELRTKPENIAHIFSGGEKSLLEDLSLSFIGKYYISDSNIIATIKKVIRGYAVEGNVVIVGRGSCIVASDIEKSFHIKLFAPLEWKIKKISERFGLTRKEAMDLIKQTEYKRSEFMKLLLKSKSESDFYDIMINCESFSEQEIIDLIFNICKERNIIT